MEVGGGNEAIEVRWWREAVADSEVVAAGDKGGRRWGILPKRGKEVGA